MAKQIKLHDYQKSIIQDMINRDKFGLFIDCGSGKTLMILYLIKLLIKHKRIKSATIIAPKALLVSVWEAEVKKWGFDFKVQIVKEKEDAKKDATIYLHTPDFLISKKYASPKSEILIIDEATKFKNNKSARTKKLYKITYKYKKIFLMTATPASNGLINLFSIIKILDYGVRLGSYITHYKNRYYNQISLYKYVPIHNAKELITNKIKDIATFYELKSNNIKFIVNHIKIKLPINYAHEYRMFLKNKILKIKDNIMIASHITTHQIRLRQLANGYLVNHDNDKILLSKHKITRLMLLLIELHEQSAIIFYQYNYEFEMMKNALQIENIKYEAINGKTTQKNLKQIIELWSKKEIRIILAQPMACGHGLNLQYGGHHIIWYSPTWDCEIYYQANHRLIRQGQLKTVVIHQLCSANTIEKYIYLALDNKQIIQNAILKALSKK